MTKHCIIGVVVGDGVHFNAIRGGTTPSDTSTSIFDPAIDFPYPKIYLGRGPLQSVVAP